MPLAALTITVAFMCEYKHPRFRLTQTNTCGTESAVIV